MSEQSWPDGATYGLLATYTQPAGAPSPMGVSIIPGGGNEYIVLGYSILAGTFGAGRTFTVDWRDASNGNTIRRFDTASMTTGTVLQGPPIQTLASATDNLAAIGAGAFPAFISGTDSLDFFGAALANTEAFTLRLRLRIKGAIPTRTVVGASVAESAVTEVTL